MVINDKLTTTQQKVLDLLRNGGQDASDYLAETFIIEAIQMLLEARLEAGLKQDEVAYILGTKQPAIARWESDFEGRITLRKYVEFAVACGKIPCDLSFIPLEEMTQFAIKNLDASRTADRVTDWEKLIEAPPLSQTTNIETQPLSTERPLLPNSRDIHVEPTKPTDSSKVSTSPSQWEALSNIQGKAA
jgi:transcriptional regulator with XRE-family HTH domain